VTSATNTLDSAVAGVTITLAGSGNADISVNSSPAGLSGDVSQVATSLNAALAAISAQTKYIPAKTGASASSAQAGLLLGNFSATNLRNELMSSVSALQASGLSANAIGLSITSSGAVKFNSSSFSTAYAQNPAGVGKLISKLYTSLHAIAASATGASSADSTTGTSITGFITAQTNSLNASINSIEQQITLLTKQSSATLRALSAQYTSAVSKQSSASVTKAYLSIFLGSSSNGSG
jgi:flagellar hook-associated protein 2